MNQETNGKPIQEPAEVDVIDLISLTKTIWKGRKAIIKTTLIFMSIGLFIAIFSLKEYTASTTMVPATQGESVGGGLSGLAAIAGIDLGSSNSGSEIPPTLYPQILNSVPFQLELLQTPLTIKGQDKNITYETYFSGIYNPGFLSLLKKYTIGLPGVIIGAIRGKQKDIEPISSDILEEGQLLSISVYQYGLINQIEGQVILDVNKKEGYISLKANMPEALAAAQLVQNAQNLLQKYIINFKIKKSKEKLKFISERFLIKKNEFKTIQNKLANFRDVNQNLSSALSQINLQKLQSEYDLTFTVYSELAKQLETQQIQVKEDTPVFTVLKPVLVPIVSVKPNRLSILITWIFIGLFIGVGLLFGEHYFKKIKEKWNVY